MTPEQKKLIREVMKALGLTDIIGVDYETFWDKDYTLSKLATTDYIMDPRFEAQIASVQSLSWAKPRVMEIGKFKTWSKTINWSKTGFLAHHAHFDGLIASHHHGIRPAFYFDTLSMARPTMPITVPRGLDPLSRSLGGPGKTRGAALTETKGKRWAEFTRAEKANLIAYGGDDVVMTWDIFAKLLKYVPLSELRLIDTTVGLYARPRVLVDKAMMQEVLSEEQVRKQAMLDALGVTAKDLGSDEVFARLLRAAGIEPPMKWSEKQSKEVYAFAKNDTEFKELVEHEDEDVAALAVARANIKSKMVESRAERMVHRADYGPQPVYLNYWGAGPGRWSGGDKVNWQNYKRGSKLRRAIHAPPGYMMVIADLAQIEARVNAWFSGQQNIVSAFFDYDRIVGWKDDPKTGEKKAIRGGPDIYRLAAAAIFGKRPEDITDEERFFGKTAVLGLGYGAGAPKFHHMCLTGAGRPKDFVVTESFTRDVHKGWRQSNAFIVSNWKKTHNLITSAFIGKQYIDDGCVAYEGVGKNGFMHLPNGMAIRYDGVENNDNELTYIKTYRVNKTKEPTVLTGRLYGGLEVENRTQALARIVVSDHALAIQDELKDKWQLVMTTHDELVGLVPTRSANKALKAVKSIMSQAPSWAPGLPVAVDAHISQRYDK